MSTTTDYSHGEPPPIPNGNPSVHDELIEYFESHYLEPDASLYAGVIRERKELGLRKYETVLQAGNGRDWLTDLIEEVTDALAYAQQGRDETDPLHESRWGVNSLHNSLRHLFCEAVRLRRQRDEEAGNASAA